MNSSAAHGTRPDQIAELTRGVQLPLAMIDQEIMKIIAEGLERAFDEVRTDAPATVATGSEAEVTALLEARLNSLIGEDALLGQLVLNVARGKESLSFNGVHIEKRPDLSIYLTARNRNFPLVVEAKIIDAASGKTEVLYCQNGVSRFVEGQYGWGGQEAFMLGYVRDGSTTSTKLTPFLAPPSQGAKTYFTVFGPHSLTGGLHDRAQSRHSRGFAYIHQQPPDHTPGPIDIWHVWFK
jgi:hypothetical protein